MTITLRHASIDDLQTLQAWDQEPHVIAASGDDDGYDWEIELPRELSWRQFLIAEKDQRPIGCIQIIDPHLEETHYWGDIEPNLRAIDVWIGPARDLGCGYGTEMMHQAIEFCFADRKVQAIVIDPLVKNTDALRFYERLGFQRVERRMFASDDCYVYRLDRSVWEKVRGS